MANYLRITCQLLLVLMPLINFCHSQNIKLVNNGYQGILIAIADSIKEDQNLITDIQDIFTKASATMFQATEKRAYFRNITILVPSNWNVNAARAVSETFEKANIRIDVPSNKYGNNPHVQQQGGCGLPGEFMHLTPEFVTNQAQSTKRWGPLDKVIVHEWGHLRWGLFDEYPETDTMDDHFYYSPITNSIQPTRCSLTVTGESLNKQTGEPCKIDPSTSLYEKTCRFYPKEPQPTAASSLMYLHYLSNIVKFCDDDDLSPEALHNYEAPSLHNKLCFGRSSWSVILDSDDFMNGNNPSIYGKQVDTQPSFNIVKRRTDNPVVIVMDDSGSMQASDNSVKLANAVRNYLRFTIANGSQVGLVKYSNDAEALTTGLVKIQQQADREYLCTLLKLSSFGSTAIGLGLQKAIQLLESSSLDLIGARIILLTDGRENKPPFISEVMPDISKRGLTVDTISLTDKASYNITSLAASTGGQSFYSSGGNDSTSLYDSYRTIDRSRYSSPSQAPITILSKVVFLNKVTKICEKIIIDRSLGRDTAFTFSWTSNTTKINIDITKPSGDVVKPRKLYGDTSSAYICIGECESGKWSACLYGTSEDSLENVVLQVDSSARGGSESNNEVNLPITVRTRLDNLEPNFQNDSRPVSVYATVTRGYSPVIGAKVVATIESPDGTDPLNLMLRDDGVLGDNIADDGIYSAFISNAKVMGKHSISVSVLGTSKTNVQSAVTVGNAARMPGAANETGETMLAPSGEFQRFSLAGFVDVKSVAPRDQDKIPPARVTDLKLAAESHNLSQITLTWTAVGDDFDSGKVKSYELRSAPDHRTLYKKVAQNITLISDDRILEGNLSQPLPVGERETITIQVEDRDTTLVYALVAVDDANNISPLSNVVVGRLVTLVAPEKLVTPKSLGEPKKRNEKQREDTHDDANVRNILMAVLIPTGSLTLIALVVVIVRQCRQNRLKNFSAGYNA